MLTRLWPAMVCAAACALCSMPASAQSAGPTVPMAQNSATVQYTFRPYGAMKIAAMVYEVGGKTAVCGMWTESERFQAYIRSSKLDRRARQTTSVKMGNLHLLKGVTFMKKVEPDQFVAGTRVPCKVTGVPWKSEFSRQTPSFGAPVVRSRS